MTIRQKLAAGFGVVLMLTLVLGIIGMHSMNTVTDRTDKADDANRLAKFVLDLRSEEKNYMLRGEPAAAGDVHAILADIESQIAVTKAKFSSAENDGLMDRLGVVVEDYGTTFERYVAIDVAADEGQQVMEAAAREVEAVLTDVREQQKEQVSALVARGADMQAILEELREADTANRLIKFMLEMRRDEKNFQLRDDAESVQQVLAGADALAASADEMRAQADRPESRAAAEGVLAELADYRAAFTRFVEGRTEQRALRPRLVDDARELETAAQQLREDQKVELASDTRTAWTLMIVVLALAMLLGVAAAVLIGRSIAGPVSAMTAAMRRLADRDWSTEVPARGRRDEIGQMAEAVQVFKDNGMEVERLEQEQREKDRLAEEEKRRLMNEMADAFEASVGAVVHSVTRAVADLEETSGRMSTISDDTRVRSADVASAAEQASANVQTVSAAAEELSSSIAEISRQVSQSTTIASRAASRVDEANAQVQGLSAAAAKIGEVVALITDIAEQTNLLALNATIEAARAGDAGKGFAVVANEVKSLANQTAKATEEIARQITSVQEESRKAVGAIESIGVVIHEVNEITSSIASAVEEQNAATGEIARNVEQAAVGTEQVTVNITGVSGSAQEASDASNHVATAAADLGRNADTLQSEMHQFMVKIRSAA